MEHKYFYINASGNSIHCKLYCTDIHAVKRAVVCLHGFTGHMDNKAVERFADFVLKKNKDIGVVIYNAPCHGDDVKKKLTLGDCDSYITLVTEYVKKRFGTEELYAYANSFGGYQVLKYISEHASPFRKLALRCPAVNMYNVISEQIISHDDQKLFKRNKPVQVGFDRKVKITQAFLDELRAADISGADYGALADSILILQGTADEIVSFDFVKSFAEKNGIAFVPVEKADHRFVDPLKMDLAIKTIAEFFDFNV